LAQHRNLPQDLRSTQVIVRLCLRLLIIVAFASFDSIGFARSFAALFCLAHGLDYAVPA
jgi:hypothetical protein